MRKETVISWPGNDTHIIDDPNLENVITQCGRALGKFEIGYNSETLCDKCGNLNDFERVWRDKRRVGLEYKFGAAMAKHELLVIALPFIVGFGIIALLSKYQEAPAWIWVMSIPVILGSFLPLMVKVIRIKEYDGF